MRTMMMMMTIMMIRRLVQRKVLLSTGRQMALFLVEGWLLLLRHHLPNPYPTLINTTSKVVEEVASWWTLDSILPKIDPSFFYSSFRLWLSPEEKNDREEEEKSHYRYTVGYREIGKWITRPQKSLQSLAKQQQSLPRNTNAHTKKTITTLYSSPSREIQQAPAEMASCCGRMISSIIEKAWYRTRKQTFFFFFPLFFREFLSRRVYGFLVTKFYVNSTYKGFRMSAYFHFMGAKWIQSPS